MAGDPCAYELLITQAVRQQASEVACADRCCGVYVASRPTERVTYTSSTHPQDYTIRPVFHLFLLDTVMGRC